MIQLVPRWRAAYKWFSVQAAVLLVLVSAARESAQHLVDTMPSLAWVAHAPWYPPTMLVLGALIALLRLVHQPVVETAAPAPPPVPVAPQPPKGSTMNAIFTSIFQAIPSMVLQVEKAITAPGSGAEKAAAVTGVVAQALPVGDSEGMAKAKQVMEFSVWALNTFGPLFFKSGTPSEPVAIAAVPAE